MSQSKTILILGAGHYQTVAIKKAQALGYHVIAVSNIENDLGKSIADNFELCSTLDQNEVLKIAKENSIVGIMTIASELASTTASFVAEELNLIWPSSKTTAIIGDKYSFQTTLKKSNILHCKKGDAPKVNYPVIVKPCKASGASGISLINNHRELKAAISKACDCSFNNSCLIEPYISGTHYGGSVIIKKREIAFLFPTLKIISEQFITLAHISISDASFHYSLSSFLTDVVQKLNLEDGFYDIDLVQDRLGEIHLIEMGSRLGGNGISSLVEFSTGYDIISAAINYAIFGEIQLPKTTTAMPAACIVYRSKKTGVISKITPSKYCNEHHAFFQSGDHVTESKQGNQQLGIGFLRADSHKDLHNLVPSVIAHEFIELQ